MDGYLTTYRKDFKWPVKQPASLKVFSDSVLLENKLDTSCKEVVTSKPPKQEEHKIQLCSIPSAANTDNQPDGFLDQLYTNNPYLYNITKAPSDATKLNTFRQRFITTYQRDFCKQEDIDQKEIAAEEDRKKCIKTDKERLVDEFRLSRLRKPTPKLMISENKDKKGGKDNAKGDGRDDSKKLWKPQISEYMDKISKTGDMIVQDKLLSRKPK